MRRLGRWAGRTAVSVVPVAIGVVVAVFMLLRIVPGDPARMILGERATPESVEALREQLGLNLPLSRQFTDFVVHLFTTGDTGASLAYDIPSRDLVLDRAPVTLALVGLAILFSVLIAVPRAMRTPASLAAATAAGCASAARAARSRMTAGRPCESAVHR